VPRLHPRRPFEYIVPAERRRVLQPRREQSPSGTSTSPAKSIPRPHRYRAPASAAPPSRSDTASPRSRDPPHLHHPLAHCAPPRPASRPHSNPSPIESPALLARGPRHERRTSSVARSRGSDAASGPTAITTPRLVATRTACVSRPSASRPVYARTTTAPPPSRDRPGAPSRA
jgi:hypothetical protein